MLELHGEKIRAVIDHEMRFINLAIPGENGSMKVLPTKIQVINQDNSILDVSRSSNDGGLVDLRQESLIYGEKDANRNPQPAISPKGRRKRLKALQTPAFG